MGKEIKSRHEAAEVILFTDDFPNNISHISIFQMNAPRIAPMPAWSISKGSLMREYSGVLYT